MARELWPVIRRVWIMVGLGATAIFVVWSLLAYRADSEARQAAVSDAHVTVTHAAGIWHFEPVGMATNPTLVFFPGALVDPRAYAPLAQAVARNGFQVLLVELPRRGMFGGAESLELRTRVKSALAFVGEFGSVVLGGHSRGAVVASAVAAGRPPTLVGLVLIGTSHPRDVDLSGLDVPVTKIAGTRDGLATPAEVRGNASLLPPQTRWIWVDGGNHSQFGWYGFQPMDRRPRVSAAEQRSAMIDGVLELLRAASTAAGARTGPGAR
jgi:pimeloyl-ACP methyl ester carboxylesterase